MKRKLSQEEIDEFLKDTVSPETMRQIKMDIDGNPDLAGESKSKSSKVSIEIRKLAGIILETAFTTTGANRVSLQVKAVLKAERETTSELVCELGTVLNDVLETLEDSNKWSGYGRRIISRGRALVKRAGSFGKGKT